MLPHYLVKINVRKQAINDKLQGSVATYARGLSITKLRKVFAESAGKKVHKIGEYLAKLQAGRWLSRALCAPGQHTAESRRKCTTQSTFFACNYATDLIFFH